MVVKGPRNPMRKDDPFYLDPNRKHTEAEAELVMACFGVGRDEAWKILNSRPSPEMLAHVADLAAMLKRQQKTSKDIENG